MLCIHIRYVVFIKLIYIITCTEFALSPKTHVIQHSPFHRQLFSVTEDTTIILPSSYFPVCTLWPPRSLSLQLHSFVFSTRFTSQRVLCSVFHNSRRVLLFPILSSLCPPHPVILSFPRLFLSDSSSCPPPSPLPAALRLATAAATTSISARLPTDSQAGLCRGGRETNSRDLCHSAKFLENIWRIIKQPLSPAAVLVSWQVENRKRKRERTAESLAERWHFAEGYSQPPIPSLLALSVSSPPLFLSSRLRSLLCIDDMRSDSPPPSAATGRWPQQEAAC